MYPHFCMYLQPVICALMMCRKLDVPSFLHVLTAIQENGNNSRWLDVPSFLHVLTAREDSSNVLSQLDVPSFLHVLTAVEIKGSVQK